MKRAILIFLMLFMAGATLSYATITRTKTMGNVDNFVYDDGNIFSWPSTVPGFSDRFILELGEDVLGDEIMGVTFGYNPSLIGSHFPVGMGGGALFSLNDYHHFGLFVTANDRGHNTFEVGEQDGEPVTEDIQGGIDVMDVDMNIDDFVTIMYGYGADNLDFGLNFNLGRSSGEDTFAEAFEDSIDRKTAVGMTGIGAGITYWLENDNSFDVAFEYTMTSVKVEGEIGDNMETLLENDGYNAFGIRARMFHNHSDELQFVPYVQFLKNNMGLKERVDEDETRSDKDEMTVIDFALGMNYFPVENVQLVTVGGLRMVSTDRTRNDEDAGKVKDNHIPYIKAGMDAEIRSWLDFRAGVEKQLYGIEDETENVTRKEGGASFQGFVGAGFHLGNLTIDTQVNPTVFFNGPNFISGMISPLNHRVSIVYPW
jgi:hypothetical protein